MQSGTAHDSEIRTSFTLELEDVLLLHRYTVPMDALRWSRKVIAGTATAGVASAVLALWMFSQNSWALTPKAAALCLFGLLAIAFAFQASQPVRLAPTQGRVQEPLRSRLLKIDIYKNAIGPQTLTISSSGLSEEREHSTVVVGWPGISRVIAAPTHIFFLQSTGEGLILPHAALSLPISVALDAIEHWWGRAAERPERQPHER
jgi:hypothetical protein